MKINYEKVNKRAINVLNEYNLEAIIISCMYDGMLPITEEDVFSKDDERANKWRRFLSMVRSAFATNPKSFGFALDNECEEGFLYGDITDLSLMGYEEISLSDVLEEEPKMCEILGVTPEETLESHLLLNDSKFGPHTITLDGVVRAANGGCLPLKELMDVFKKADFGFGENGLYGLLGLTPGDVFVVEGYAYEGFKTNDNLESFLNVCESNMALLYELIDNPGLIVKIYDIKRSKGKSLGLKNNG